MRTERGFSLIELLIVLVILSIIAVIAVPSYTAQAQRSRRTDAAASLGLAAMVMESCRSDLATYTGCTGRVSTASEESLYTLAVVVTGGGSAYTLTATATDVQAQDDLCDTLTLNSQGTRGFTGTAPDVATCWGV